MKSEFSHGRSWAHWVGLAMALTMCALVAWCAGLIQWSSPVRQLVPFAMLCLVLLVGLIFGRAAGILGSVIAAAVLAYTMYEPMGSLRISDQSARSAVGWMLLAGVSLSYLLLPAHTDRSRRGH